jgi:hypothetical protein
VVLTGLSGGRPILAFHNHSRQLGTRYQTRLPFPQGRSVQANREFMRDPGASNRATVGTRIREARY